MINKTLNRKKSILKYWSKRAFKHKRNPTATTNDVCLRELEIITILSTLRSLKKTKNISVLDVGCADGFSSIKIAEALPKINLVGVDYSNNMIKIAKNRLRANPKLGDRVKFIVGDASRLDDCCGNTIFDVILSDRLLINLDSVTTQRKVISNIAKHLVSRGYYIAIENFIEGHRKMNETRKHVGLPEIPLRWHNLFLKKEGFLRYVSPLFKVISFNDFASAYYFATRVVYSKMCQMRNKEPNYTHDIHKLAIDLPWFGDFSPVKMVVMRKKIN